MLSVGADDSNHAALSPKYELNVTPFSTVYEDSLVKPFPNTRDYESTRKWIADPRRDFRFGILTKEKYSHTSNNLVVVIPKIILLYLDEKDLSPETLKIYFDGRIDQGSRANIRDFFVGKRGIERVVVDNFIKKRRGPRGEIIKRPNCPAVVYHADVLASSLLGLRAQELFSHPKLVLTD